MSKARIRQAALEADRARLADLLGQPEGRPAPSSGPAAVGEASGELPALADVVAELGVEGLDDAFLEMLDTGEERDPDAFDDSLFFDPAPDPVPDPAPPSPPLSARVKRVAGVWQGRQDQTIPSPEAVSAGAPSEALLRSVLANNNVAPPPAPTLESLLREQASPDDDTGMTADEAEAAAVAKANLAFVLAFGASEDDDGFPVADTAGDKGADPDLLADILAFDPVVETQHAPPIDASSPAPGPSADLLEAGAAESDDEDRDWALELALILGEEPGKSEEDDWDDPQDDVSDWLDLGADDTEMAADSPGFRANPAPELDLPAAPDPAQASQTAGPQSDPEDQPAGFGHTPAAPAMQDLAEAELLSQVLRGGDGGTPDPGGDQKEIVSKAPPPTAPAAPSPVREPAAPPQREPREPLRRGGMHDLDQVLRSEASRKSPARKWLIRLIWLALLGGLIYAAFLPYKFEVGGEFTIQPFDRAEVRARTGGEITDIHVREGDWVEAGTVIAVLSNWNQTRDVALIRSEGERLQAQLATLMAGARTEEITLAEQALESAEVQLAMRAQDLQRQEALFASGTVAQKLVEDSRSAHQLALSERNHAAAALALVQAGPRDSEIDALKATIAGNAEELAFAELMLEYTNIRAPVSGQIVSSMTAVPVGHSLSLGGLFAEIEDNRVVIAELAVPEITIEEVELGAPVELRLWSDTDAVITGTVRSIAPRAEEQDFGRVVRVQVEVANPDGKLAANSTGFGKIAAEERLAWQAFSRAIERFFVIEVWSWLP